MELGTWPQWNRPQKLAVKGGVTSAASGCEKQEMKADCWSAESATVSKEGDKEALLTTTKSAKVEDAAAGKEASSMEAECGMCEVEEQQAVRVEASEKKWWYVWKKAVR